MKFNKLNTTTTIFTGIFLSILFKYDCSAQDEQIISTIFEKEDKSKFEKANELKSKADGLIDEANQFYLETFQVQANYELDENTIKTKVEQLENKAQAKQLEAADYYLRCNETKFTINKTYIEKFWKNYKGDQNTYLNAKLIEEQSNDYYFQSRTLRHNGSKIKDVKEKIKKFNEAYDLEFRSLQKQYSALGIYYHLNLSEATEKYELDQTSINEENYQPVIETPHATEEYDTNQLNTENTPFREYTTATPQSTSDLELNEQILDLYNRYINDSAMHGSDVLSADDAGKIAYYNSEQIINRWYDYAYKEIYNEEIGHYENIAEDSLMADSTIAQLQQEGTSSEKPIYITDSKMIPAGEDVIYRVQIASNKTMLPQKALSKIFYGNKTVEMINEDGWYKYSIGDFNDYSTADTFRVGTGVATAVIVAYRTGTKFHPLTSEEKEISTEKSFEPANIPYEGLIFKVQIAANRVPLSKEQLNRIYSGQYSIEVINEDGWYKYQILGVRLFSDALRIINAVHVKGVFASAYQNGEKINLLEAAKISKTLEQQVQKSGRKGILDDVEFHVQLAASRLPIHNSELNRIYSGSGQVILIIEENWYKYRITAGTSYEKALEIKKNCGIPNSFVVSYDRAVKIPLYRAIQKVK